MSLTNRWDRLDMLPNIKCVQIKTMLINQIWICSSKIIQQVSKNILSIKVNRIFIKCTWITYPKAVKQMEEFHNKWIRKTEIILKQTTQVWVSNNRILSWRTDRMFWNRVRKLRIMPRYQLIQLEERMLVRGFHLFSSRVYRTKTSRMKISL